MNNNELIQREDCSLLAFFSERDAELKSIERQVKARRRACIAVISVCAAFTAYIGILISML